MQTEAGSQTVAEYYHKVNTDRVSYNSSLKL